jgi:hypothetical protein
MNENRNSENNDQAHSSEEWKTRFALLEKIGANDNLFHIKMDCYNALSFKEKLSISFNALAFLFGPIYYFSKEMWLKGAFLFGAALALAVIFSLHGIFYYWILSGIIFSTLAN